MRPPKTSYSGNALAQPRGSDNAGAIVLVLIAIAAFCGWFILVHDRPSDSRPLAVVQQPLIPPSLVDTSSQLPGHTHYSVFAPDGAKQGD